MHKETLWKIKDLENILDKRISEHKVNSLLDSLEKRLNTKIK